MLFPRCKSAGKVFPYVLPTLFTSLFFVQKVQCQKIDDPILELTRVIDSLKGVRDFQKDTLYLHYLNKLAYQMAYVNLDSMLLLSHEADSISRNLGYKMGELEAANNRADHKMITGNLREALALHENIVNEAKSGGFHHVVAKSFNSIAFIQNQEYDYVGAFEALNEGISFCNGLESTDLKMRMKMNLGILYAEIGDYENAIDEFNFLLKTDEVNTNKFVKAQILSNLGFTQKKNQEFEKSLINTKKAVALFEEEKQNR